MSQYPETVYVNGDAYIHGDDGVEIKDGHVFREDQNHSGYMWLTQDVVDKYHLQPDSPLSEIYDDEEMEEMMEDDDPEYKYSISFYHACEWLNPNTGKWEDDDTPFGELYSEDFVAWYNDFPEELFKLGKEDGVFHGGFCDG